MSQITAPFAAFASAGEVQASLLFLQGAGWDRYTVSEFPSVVRGCFAVILDADGPIIDTLLTLSVTLAEDDRVHASTTVIFPAVKKPEKGRMPGLVQFALPTFGPCTLVGRLMFEDRVLVEQFCPVAVPPATPPARPRGRR